MCNTSGSKGVRASEPVTPLPGNLGVVTVGEDREKPHLACSSKAAPLPLWVWRSLSLVFWGKRSLIFSSQGNVFDVCELPTESGLC